MPGLNTRPFLRTAHAIVCAATIFVFVNADVTEAQTETTAVTLRAIGPHLNDNAVRFIAKNAEPVHLDAATFADRERSSPKEIITKLCGSVRDAYYAEFLAANNLKSLHQDEPLGERAKELVWPACLYAQPVAGGLKTTVRPGDTAISIYTRLTGGRGSPAAVERFFKRPIDELTNLKPKEVIVGAHATAPVTLVPKDGDAATFVSKLRREAGSTVQWETVFREVQLQGEVVLGLPPPSVGQAASTTRTCKSPSHPPYEAAVVEHAYRFAKGRAESASPRFPAARADVVVVDNGFFGANPQAQPGDPFAGSPFSSQYFKVDNRATVAQQSRSQMISGRSISPTISSPTSSAVTAHMSQA